jgi:hypothetical protein
MQQATPSPVLPKPIAAYFTDDKGDTELLPQCFTQEAIVDDEGHAHTGRAAIKAWKTDASAKYQYTCEPVSCEESAGQTIVTSHLVGNFLGSHVNLRFIFTLAGDQIAMLEIVP